jgi:hypothetical protein
MNTMCRLCFENKLFTTHYYALPHWVIWLRLQSVAKYFCLSRSSVKPTYQRCRLSWLTNCTHVCEPKYGGVGIAVPQPMRTPNKLWRSNSIFNLCSVLFFSTWTTIEDHTYLCEYAWTHEHPAHSRNISPQSPESSPQREKNVKNILKLTRQAILYDMLAHVIGSLYQFRPEANRMWAGCKYYSVSTTHSLYCSQTKYFTCSMYLMYFWKNVRTFCIV